MKICMISYDMQDFGGLEEYAVSLALALKNSGNEVSYLSCAWVSPDNQYVSRLKANNIQLVQPPKWISDLACNWNTKENLLQVVMAIFSPVVAFLGIGLTVFKRRRLVDAWQSSYNFLRGILMNNIIGPDYRKILGPILLSWWQIRWHPEIYHIQGYTNTLLFSVEWAHRNGIPVVYEEHQTPDPQFNWWQGFEKSINKAGVVVAVSEKSADALRTICGVTQPIVVQGPLVPDPVDVGFQLNGIKRDDNLLQLTAVSRLYVTKGLIYLLDALKIVKEKYPNVALKIYGEGPLRTELMEHAQLLGLDGDKIFMGAFTSRKQLSQIMSETDVFVMPSILEGQPVSLVEAMSYGRPVIATTVGGIPELIQDGVNGLLCAPGDVKCLAQKITAVVEDASLRARLGVTARTSYENGPFQPASVSHNFELIYGRALNRR